jgi:hypothetical protein
MRSRCQDACHLSERPPLLTSWKMMERMKRDGPVHDARTKRQVSDIAYDEHSVGAYSLARFSQGERGKIEAEAMGVAGGVLQVFRVLNGA